MLKKLNLFKGLRAMFSNKKESVKQHAVLDVNSGIALKRGRFLGAFFNVLNELGIDNTKNTTSKLHNMSDFYNEFGKAIEKTSEKKILKARSYISKIAELKEEMHILEDLKTNKQLPVRVTYTDTKIADFEINHKKNVSDDVNFNRVMPDIIHYDFGDVVRTTCCSVSEDEKELDKVMFDMELYVAYKKGFLSQMEKTLTTLEIKNLDLSVKTMIFMMGLRYLTDYFNGNVTYKVTYKDQNLDRAKNQFKLLDSFILQADRLTPLAVEEKKHIKYTETPSIKSALSEYLEESKAYHQTILCN